MTKKTGLGRGLDALFSAGAFNDVEEQATTTNNNIPEQKIDDSEIIHKIKISEIEPNKNQPRRSFDNESIDELSESIKRYGVIQPIIVTKKDNF